jgi:transcriptional regulator with XRE-family HTH domain
MEASMDKKVLGARLRELREAAGLSQKALAERAGLSQRNVANWELGLREPILSGAVAVAKALGVTVEALLEEPESITEPKRGRPAKGKADAEVKPRRKGAK